MPPPPSDAALAARQAAPGEFAAWLERRARASAPGGDGVVAVGWVRQRRFD